MYLHLAFPGVFTYKSTTPAIAKATKLGFQFLIL
jgi:hypothetical protein